MTENRFTDVDPSAQYKDGSILYKLIQLREVGDDSPNRLPIINLISIKKRLLKLRTFLCLQFHRTTAV